MRTVSMRSLLLSAGKATAVLFCGCALFLSWDRALATDSVSFNNALSGNVHSYSMARDGNRVFAYYRTEPVLDADVPYQPGLQFQPVSYGEFQLDRRLQSGKLHLASAFGKSAAVGQFGWSRGATRFDGFAGYGRDTSVIRSRYSGVDPYHFHGGSDVRYEYSGFAVSRKLSGRLEVGFAQARIVADGLEDRSVNALSVSARGVYASYAEVDRGSERVGRAYALGTVFKGHRFGIDYLEQDNGASYQGLNYSHRHRGVDYRVSFRKTENPLYLQKNDTSLTLSMAFSFGRSPDRLFATEPAASEGESEGEEKDTLSGGQAALIAGGIVGVGVAISSGSSDSDDSFRLESQHAAARNILNQVNPISVDENREYGGYIYRNPDGSFSHTKPVTGGPASLLLPPISSVVPSGSAASATYHTHAAFDPRFDNENFSPTDIQTNILLGVDGYLGTPAGAFKYYQLSTGQISTLGTIAN